MVMPSIRLVLVLTSLQVYILSSAESLTLPLKTVSQCESFTKKLPKPKAEYPISDSVTAESSKPDKPFSTLLPTGISINLAQNSARYDSVVNAKETLCLAPVIPKNSSFIRSCPDLPKSGALSSNENCLVSNQFGLKLPVSVSNTVASLPCPNVKSTPVISLSGCPKSRPISTANVALEDCVSASTVQSANPILSNSAFLTNSGLSYPTACSSNAYSPGFKSAFSVSSTSSNVNSVSPNPTLESKCENINTNIDLGKKVPGSLDLSLQSPPNNIGIDNMLVTQSCHPNNLPVSSNCNMNVGSNSSPFTNPCSSNVVANSLPQSQACQISTGNKIQTLSSNKPIDYLNNLPSCHTNTNNLAVALNPAPNNLPLQPSHKNILPRQQDCSSNIAQNTLCNQSPTSQAVSDTIPLKCVPANQCKSFPPLNVGTPSLSSINIGNNLLTTPPQSQTVTPPGIKAASANIPSVGLSTSYPLCVSEIPINTITKQNFPYITSTSSAEIPKSDGPCPISSQPIYSSGLSINTNNFGPNCKMNQTQFTPDSTEGLTPNVPIIQNAIIYPTIQTYPPPANVNPITNPIKLQDQIAATPIDPTMLNTCPMTPISKTSINEYFKGVKAATSKLNDFISSFSNKFGIKSFPTMQQFPSTNSDALQQPNTVKTSCPEGICNCGLPSYISKPTATFPPTSQSNICPCGKTTLFKQEQPSSCSILNRDYNQPETSPLAFIQSSTDNTISAPSPCQASSAVLSLPTATTILQKPPPVSFKAPVVPKTIVSSFHYPVCPSTFVNNTQYGLSSLSCKNYSPFTLSNLPKANPSNLMSKLNFGSCNLPFKAPTTSNPPNFLRPSVSSILNGDKVTSFLPNPIVSKYDDVTNILIPDILSAVLPKKSSCPCETCRKSFPFLSSISINTSPDCDTMSDCSTAMCNIDECSVDLSSIQKYCLSSDLLPSLDESQLDECCTNLENIIAMLELSLNLNGGFDCDLDSVPDILSTL